MQQRRRQAKRHRQSAGVVGDEANAIMPGKRMLSSMSPTLLIKDGAVRYIVGTPGGSTIFTSVFQTVLNAQVHGMSLQDAVDARRFHHQLPGALSPDQYQNMQRLYLI